MRNARVHRRHGSLAPLLARGRQIPAVSQFLDAAGLWVIEVLLVKDDPGTCQALWFSAGPASSPLRQSPGSRLAIQWSPRFSNFSFRTVNAALSA
jgi:hypothetical protein